MGGVGGCLGEEVVDGGLKRGRRRRRRRRLGVGGVAITGAAAAAGAEVESGAAADGAITDSEAGDCPEPSSTEVPSEGAEAVGGRTEGGTHDRTNTIASRSNLFSAARASHCCESRIRAAVGEQESQQKSS